ncbi:MAG TPA: tRNA (adenosine(37)-N6)-threonylcarbamoyltransferase complex ATPase subunit type 1 TsaE [Tepidisphaeraceae bacterium]|nr:tRNA (adenosine(37)-N6)-threonylcarbamoyltransferase complex ATPase subunit type 1 TsaE [Tepidisphaeraceae bacterium]
MSDLTYTTASVAETEAVAATIARECRGGEVIALSGDLGAGKTQFVRGLVRALGGNPRAVSSPTFVLLNVYDGGRFTIYHLDAYRVGGADDFEAIGFTELLEQGGVVAVEWPERVADLLPTRIWRVRLTALDETRRLIEVLPPAPLPRAAEG